MNIQRSESRPIPTWARVATVSLVAATIAWIGVTAYLLGSSNPPSPGGSGEAWLPRWVLLLVGHAFLFAVLSGLLCSIPVAMRLRPLGLVVSAIVVAIAAGYGAGLELYQATVPERQASWTDGFVNTVGAITGAITVSVAVRLAMRRRDGTAVQ
jgi:hypothetical protein